MTRQEALKFWEWRYENAKDYYDDHWEADERRSHREYVEALEWAVKTLADRKTEPNSSEKPNNCEGKNYCDDCLYTDTCDSKEFFYACTSKATISKMEQVDKDINVRSKDCTTCKHAGEVYEDPCELCYRHSHYEPKDEPQTDGYISGEDFMKIFDEPQTDCPWK